MRFKKKEQMTEEEFFAKYFIPTPSDSRERDLILMSCLSDIQHLVSINWIEPEELNDRLNNIKEFIKDTNHIPYACKN